jgi:hypothetical protein
MYKLFIYWVLTRMQLAGYSTSVCINFLFFDKF